MEDYESNRNYLFHLKRITEIKSGIGKKSLTPLCSTRLKENDSIFQNKRTPITDKNRNTTAMSNPRLTTERIMREYHTQKENNRLVERIANIEGTIFMKKYARQYKENKSLMRIHSKAKRTIGNAYFKFFDILFDGCPSFPDDFYRVYHIVGNKKTLIANDSLFQLRKIELKIKKGVDTCLKIEGKNEGIVEIKNENLLPLIKNGQHVGNVIIQITKF